jgi:hypothetical protein
MLFGITSRRLNMAKRVKGGYKNRITEERAKNKTLSDQLAKKNHIDTMIGRDIDNLGTLIVVLAVNCIILPFFGNNLSSCIAMAISTSIGFFIARSWRNAKEGRDV